MAEEASDLHIEGLASDCEAIPEPSRLVAVMADAENQDSVAILVAVKTEAKMSGSRKHHPARRRPKAIDAFAEAQGLTRSGFLRAAKHEIGYANDDNNDNYAKARLRAQVEHASTSSLVTLSSPSSRRAGVCHPALANGKRAEGRFHAFLTVIWENVPIRWV